MLNGLMGELDGLRVVLKAEKGLDKAPKPLPAQESGDGHGAGDTACRRTRQQVSPTSLPLLAFEYVLTHPGMFLDTQRSWTVYLQSEKTKIRKELVSDHIGKVQSAAPPRPLHLRPVLDRSDQSGAGDMGS